MWGILLCFLKVIESNFFFKVIRNVLVKGILNIFEEFGCDNERFCYGIWIFDVSEDDGIL